MDQAGFRPRFSTLHHLSAFVFIQEKAYEWQQPVWMAALDFRKAIDSVEHECLWNALQHQGLPQGYVRILSSLYKGQSGRVRTDRLSRPYNICVALSRAIRSVSPIQCVPRGHNARSETQMDRKEISIATRHESDTSDKSAICR